MPTFAIITPVFNGIDHLRYMRDTLKQQTLKDFEWIVVNDGSEDATKRDYEEEISGLSFPAKIVHIENGGQGRARNIGISESTAPWICTIDVDDPPYANKIETLASLIKDHSEKQVIIGAHALQVKRGNHLRNQYLTPTAFSNNAEIRKLEIKRYFKGAANFFPSSAVFFTRYVVEESGIKYIEDRELIGVEDYIFNMMVLSIADKIVTTKQVCGIYLRHPGNISRATFHHFQSVIKALIRVAEELDLKEALRWAIASKCASYASPLYSSGWKLKMATFKYGVSHSGLIFFLRAFLSKSMRNIYKFLKTMLLT
ncbi:glycosyltransferase family A protein [Candidatus Omnitrophota bacterium]